jgi:hypothetical protein
MSEAVVVDKERIASFQQNFMPKARGLQGGVQGIQIGQGPLPRGVARLPLTGLNPMAHLIGEKAPHPPKRC